ncbi:hypothetical protein CHELA20_51890 [Hyphomicrobiales bacterium]|nr:hypothetical protein CHELA41_23122 [Hyphomicrobiales bacterium]CAH1679227.1 hypothetical protein CHELA20_51890 [Hyphomicrobiales bacterium]
MKRVQPTRIQHAIPPGQHNEPTAVLHYRLPRQALFTATHPNVETANIESPEIAEASRIPL